MSKTKRVVITGMGIVSSIGNNVEAVKNSLINQKSGIVSSEIYKEMGFRSQIHGDIKINLEDHIDKKQLRFMGAGFCLRCSIYGTSNHRCRINKRRSFQP